MRGLQEAGGCIHPDRRDCFHWETSQGVFPPNKLWLLNRLRSGFLEPLCYLQNQTTFAPVLSRSIIIKDTSSTEGVAGSIMICRIWHTNYSSQEKPLLFDFSWSQHFWFRINFFLFCFFCRNAGNGSKPGAQTGFTLVESPKSAGVVWVKTGR